MMSVSTKKNVERVCEERKRRTRGGGGGGGGGGDNTPLLKVERGRMNLHV
jgi:hypothetical protein